MSFTYQFTRGLDLDGKLPASLVQSSEVTLNLKPMPELGGLAEEGTEADRHGGRDCPSAQDDLVDGAGRHADGAGHGVLRNTHREQVFFEEDFAGCNGRAECHNEMRNPLNFCDQGYRRCSQ